jgi:hypothetical protein
MSTTMMSDEVLQRHMKEGRVRPHSLSCYVWIDGDYRWYGGLFNREEYRRLRVPYPVEGTCAYRVTVIFK